MTKKLLIFCGGYLIGGQEIVTINYIKELIKLKVQVHCIINSWSDGDFENRLTELSIPFTSVKLGFIYPKKPFWTLDTLLCFPNAIKKIKFVISSFKPDAYYHTSYRTIFMLQHFLKTEHILHVHENIAPNYFNKYLLKSINGKTKKFITVSETTKNYLIRGGINSSKIEVLYNGTEILPITKKVKKDISLNLGIVGQIAPHKGHETLIEALTILKQRNIYFKLNIFGKGSSDYVNYLKKLIVKYELNDAVEWMGFNTNLDYIYSQIDILIMPTQIKEAFGMIIIEAGIRSVPTLAANVGGPSEIIKDNYNGWLFESGNVLNLVLKLENLKDKNINFEDITENNYHRICAKFDIRKQASQLESIIFDTCNTH